MFDQFYDEEWECRQFLQDTPRENWPDFIKDCKLINVSPKSQNPMNWREGFEADIYDHLPHNALMQLHTFILGLDYKNRLELQTYINLVA